MLGTFWKESEGQEVWRSVSIDSGDPLANTGDGVYRLTTSDGKPYFGVFALDLDERLAQELCRRVRTDGGVCETTRK